MIKIINENLLQNGSGLFLPTLLADFLVFGILVCLMAMIYSPIKRMYDFQVSAKQIGGHKSHWFWGDAKLVSETCCIVLHPLNSALLFCGT